MFITPFPIHGLNQRSKVRIRKDYETALVNLLNVETIPLLGERSEFADSWCAAKSATRPQYRTVLLLGVAKVRQWER